MKVRVLISGVITSESELQSFFSTLNLNCWRPRKGMQAHLEIIRELIKGVNVGLEDTIILFDVLPNTPLARTLNDRMVLFC